MYKTRFVDAMAINEFGTSGLVYVSYEKAVNRTINSFLSLKGGIGYLQGSDRVDPITGKPIGGKTDAGLAFPLSVTKNFLFNNLKKQVYKRVMIKCKSDPQKFAFELFGNVGIGYIPQFYSVSKPKNLLHGIIGFREQIIFNSNGYKPHILFFKQDFMPGVYLNNTFKKNTFTKNLIQFGITAGVSI